MLHSSFLRCMHEQVRLIRLRLEAHKEGTAGTLLQGIDDNGSQACHSSIRHPLSFLHTLCLQNQLSSADIVFHTTSQITQHCHCPVHSQFSIFVTAPVAWGCA